MGFSSKKEFKKGMNAGVKLFQTKVSELNNNLAVQYQGIQEKLSQLDKTNDCLIDEIKRLQNKDIYGLNNIQEYSEILSEDINKLLITYFIIKVEESKNVYQYEFLKGCCVKLNQYSTIEETDEKWLVEKMGELCNIPQAEAVVNLLALFYANNSLETFLEFIDSEYLDEFQISNKKIRDIKAYVSTMVDIYGKKICFLFGQVDDISFNEKIIECEITDPEEMYAYGKRLVSSNRIGGLGWIIKAAEKGCNEASDFIQKSYFENMYILGYKSKKVYYVSKSHMEEGIIKVFCFDENDGSQLIFLKENAYKGSLVETPAEHGQYIAFAVYVSILSRAYMFSINVNSNTCKEIDDWKILDLQFPYMKKSGDKIAYGVMEFDLMRIRNNADIEDYCINFDGSDKEMSYR